MAAGVDYTNERRRRFCKALQTSSRELRGRQTADGSGIVEGKLSSNCLPIRRFMSGPA